jgi:hypothetical protein
MGQDHGVTLHMEIDKGIALVGVHGEAVAVGLIFYGHPIQCLLSTCQFPISNKLILRCKNIPM